MNDTKKPQINNHPRRFIAALLIALAIFIVGYAAGSNEKGNEVSMVDVPEDGEVSLMFDTGVGQPLTFVGIPVVGSQSLGDILQQIQNEGKIAVEAIDYGPEMGIFIESINGFGGDQTGHWWQFWVNNAYTQVGVSSYMVKPGDVILFKYTDSSFEE